jgi:hypothetical protein
MKRIIKIVSLLFLITITCIGCKNSYESSAQKVAQEFGRNIYTVDAQKVFEYKKWVKEGEKIDLTGVDITKTGGVIPHTQEYIKIIQFLDKNIQPLMTEKGYEIILASRFNTLSAEVCDRGNYILQVTDFILDKNLYGEKEDKAGYYYEAKLKFISTTGKGERTDTAKGYIGLLKENGQWKVFVYKLETYPNLYKEILINKL